LNNLYCHKPIISYKGTNYFAWQDLGNNNYKPRVHKSIQTVLDKICKYQIRYIMGALFELGNKKLSLKDISEALKNHKEEKISVKAKSKDLQLVKISY